MFVIVFAYKLTYYFIILRLIYIKVSNANFNISQT